MCFCPHSLRDLSAHLLLCLLVFFCGVSFPSWVVQIVQEVSVILGKKESHVMKSFFGDLCEAP